MSRIHRSARWAFIRFACLLSIGAGVATLFSRHGALDLRLASTFELAGLLGLLVLPVAALGALQFDRRHALSGRDRDAGQS